MLPSHIYESLPYLYLLLALGAVAGSGMNGAVIVCSAVLASAATMILKMRRNYRRNLRLVGLSQRI